jgi:hypothetical protein
MRKVHSARQLFHLFCNMTNADLEGFRTSSSNVYFENGVLFSYGAHYPMARKLGVGIGHEFREIVLINSEKSSVTTQKHKSQIRSSTKPNQWVFYVPNIREPRASENVEHLMNEVVDSIDAVLRCLKYNYIDEVTRKIDTFNQYATAFRLKRFTLNAEFYTLLAILSRDTQARNEVKEKEKYARQDAERAANRARWANEVKLWYTCENTTNISSAYFGLEYDPIRVNGEIVESPRGVKVSLEDARAFALALKSGRVQVGDKIDAFEVESIDEKFIQIGCHKLNIEQALNAVLGG